MTVCHSIPAPCREKGPAQSHAVRHWWIASAIILVSAGSSAAFGQSKGSVQADTKSSDSREFNRLRIFFGGLSHGLNAPLELLPEQVEKIRAILNQWHEIEKKGILSDGRVLPDGHNTEEEKFAELISRAKELESEINERILLPHQAKILKELLIATQVASSGGLLGWLRSDKVVDAFQINAAQTGKLDAIAKERDLERKRVNERWRKQIGDVDQSFNEKILAILDSADHSAFREKYGMDLESALASLTELRKRQEEQQAKQAENAGKGTPGGQDK